MTTHVVLCPQCEGKTQVISTDDNNDAFRRRRRECSDCGYRYSTAEISIDEYKSLVSAVDREGGADWARMRKVLSRSISAQLQIVTMIDGMKKVVLGEEASE